MQWLHLLDVGFLRLTNITLSNRFFDVIMPLASGNPFFFPAALIAGILLCWKGGVRGRICVLMLALVVAPGDGLICNTIKQAVARPRPYITYADILTPGSKSKRNASDDLPAVTDAKAKPDSKGGYNSMPSSHAANWFAATMVLFIYYRRSLRIMLSLACIVSFSRIYNGVHYPSDVLAGAILGAGYAVAGLWLYNALWRWAGRRWFPIWWQKMPSLVNPEIAAQAPEPGKEPPRTAQFALRGTDSHWLHLGYVVIVLFFLLRLAYVNSDIIQLSEDEAYQWVWSKHLALSYYSKPPMIAYTQFLGTHIWGDTQLGVRFFSPVIAALTGFLLLRFISRYVNARAGFVLLLVSATTPLLALGSTVMTIDPLSVFFWIMAMISGWRAVQPGRRTADWIWTGVWMGFGLLSKYTALFQLLCWVIFFILWKPAREQLRRPGPYLALLVNAFFVLPILIWNKQHGWATVTHVAENAGLHGSGGWKPRILDFVGLEFALLNPIYFVAMVWAGIAFWRRMRSNSLALYFFSMGAPLFLCYLLWSIHSRVFPNWIAPCILPLFCLMIFYWNDRWKETGAWSRKALGTGLVLGLIVVVFMHDTNLVGKIIGRPLPTKLDPLVRVRGWKESAELVDGARQKLAAEGKPVFIIGGHYGITGLINFYLPEANTNIDKTLLAYAITSDQPKNQFYFWPGYRELRRGQNAIFVRELPQPKLAKGWFRKWLKGRKDIVQERELEKEILPPIIKEEFESVTDLGPFDVTVRGRVLHTYEIFECRNLK